MKNVDTHNLKTLPKVHSFKVQKFVRTAPAKFCSKLFWQVPTNLHFNKYPLPLTRVRNLWTPLNTSKDGKSADASSLSLPSAMIRIKGRA